MEWVLQMDDTDRVDWAQMAEEFLPVSGLTDEDRYQIGKLLSPDYVVKVEKLISQAKLALELSPARAKEVRRS